MYSEVLSTVRTVTEAARLEEEIDMLLVSLYKTQEGAFEQTLEKEVRSFVGSSIKEELAGESVGKKDYLEGLKKSLDTLKVVRLTIASEPTESGLTKIQSWIHSNLGEGVISDINYNPRILAGAVVVYAGKYTDLSLKSKFETILGKKKAVIFNQLAKSDKGANQKS